MVGRFCYNEADPDTDDGVWKYRVDMPDGMQQFTDVYEDIAPASRDERTAYMMEQLKR